jgi:hypothetical protein
MSLLDSPFCPGCKLEKETRRGSGLSLPRTRTFASVRSFLNRLRIRPEFSHAKKSLRFWITLPKSHFTDFFWPNAIWPKHHLTEHRLTEHHLTERPFDRKAIWPKGRLTERPFDRKAIWPKHHLIKFRSNGIRSNGVRSNGFSVEWRSVKKIGKMTYR